MTSTDAHGSETPAPSPGADPEALRELREIHARQLAVMRDSAETRARLDAIRGTLAWRTLEVGQRLRGRLRIVLMRARGWRRPLRVRRTRRVLQALGRTPLGVNVAGYLDAESGMGEAARLSIRSLQSAGVPLALNNVRSRLRTQDQTLSGFSDGNPHPFNLVHLNADNMHWFAWQRGRKYFRNKYTIGYWFWELGEFRHDWQPGFSYVDEVWTATEFVRATLARRSRLPVACMPLPVVPPAPIEPREKTAARLGLRPDQFVFLFTFDVSSQMERKNPFGVVEAFRRAFDNRRDVVLIMKYTNGEYDRAAVVRLQQAASPVNALLLEGYMDRGELASLIQASDCYVSLHRSEGYGLTIAEAMSLGKPAIATGYSGNIDFMTADNSYLVDFRMIRLQRDHGPYLAGFSWADPDLDHAASLMAEVAANRRAAAAKGARAKEDLQRWRAPELTGGRIRARLEELRAGRVHTSLLAPMQQGVAAF